MFAAQIFVAHGLMGTGLGGFWDAVDLSTCRRVGHSAHAQCEDTMTALTEAAHCNIYDARKQRL